MFLEKLSSLCELTCSGPSELPNLYKKKLHLTSSIPGVYPLKNLFVWKTWKPLLGLVAGVGFEPTTFRL